MIYYQTPERIEAFIRKNGIGAACEAVRNECTELYRSGYHRKHIVDILCREYGTDNYHIRRTIQNCLPS